MKTSIPKDVIKTFKTNNPTVVGYVVRVAKKTEKNVRVNTFYTEEFIIANLIYVAKLAEAAPMYRLDNYSNMEVSMYRALIKPGGVFEITFQTKTIFKTVDNM